jgi:hypothetical protein
VAQPDLQDLPGKAILRWRCARLCESFGSMRLKHLLLPMLVLTLVYAGCESDDIKETGITRAAAIKIAEQHCDKYPDVYGYVDRAEWDPDGEFWLVALTDYNGDHGRAYKIGRDGGIIDSHAIDRDGDEDYGEGHHFWYYW